MRSHKLTRRTLLANTGRVLDYTRCGDNNRKLCGLYLSLLSRMGTRAKRFGDATAELAGL